MYFICKPTKVQIYINAFGKNIAQIKKELGCDAIVNGGLYNMSSWTPCCWLRSDGINRHTEDWQDYGLAWNTTDVVMDLSRNISKYRNFISCVSLCKHGKPLDLSYPTAIGGKRARTAIGTMSDGRLVMFCVPESQGLTPEQLRSDLIKLGAVNAIMLDGGASTQCILPNGTLSSQRIVHNLIAVWTKPIEEKPSTCPYAEPTKNLYIGNRGDSVRWLQWKLAAHGIPCAVDGIFGWGTWNATRTFQRLKGLVADGICGRLTREELVK